MGLRQTTTLRSIPSPLSGLPAPTPQSPSGAPFATRSFLFHSMEDANNFRASVESARFQSGDLVSYLQTHSYASRYNGTFFRSTMGREAFVYGYAPIIYRNDREYLVERDPTAAMLIEDQWTTLWNGLPATYVPEIDAYLAEQSNIGLTMALQAGYQEYYQEGGAIIYCETGADPESPLSRGERPIRWRFIPAWRIMDTAFGGFGYALVQPGPDALNPLLDHGIEYLTVYLTESDQRHAIRTKLHGTRFFPVNLDPRYQDWWRSAHTPFHRVYDTLWDMRDLIFARVRAGFQGDPIVVDVDLSADAQAVMNLAGMTQAQRDQMSSDAEAAIRAYDTGAKTTFAPVLGLKMRRLGAAQLPDPAQDYAALGARLSHGSIYSVKEILASTKGNMDSGDQDILHKAAKVTNIRHTWGYKHLCKVLLMGRVMGASSLRMQPIHDMPPPGELDWPLIRPLTPRDAAFTQKTDALVYREAQEAGLKPPARLQRLFEQDPRYPMPLWLAARGRNVDGTNTDVDPRNEPGSANGPGQTQPSTPSAPAPPKSNPADKLPIPLPSGPAAPSNTSALLDDIRRAAREGAEEALETLIQDPRPSATQAA
jgi:hypothetical protein